MRIACLQFAPQVGDVDNNLNRADSVLNRANPEDLDLLVLPELAFSGYNFKSLNDIAPFLEPTGAGITSLWARTIALKYNCIVAAGYPEKVDVSRKWPTSPEYYNSLILVNEEGETTANYRKTHLYYTDETWALENPDGFFQGEIDGLGRTAMGICMDLNPYRFEAPWSAYEFAFHILDSQAQVVIVSMAWLTREESREFSRMPNEPDMETVTYWIKRLEPLIRAETEEEVIIILANRSGVEGDAVYAGTSTVLGIKQGEVSVYGILGRGEKELLVVDTDTEPYAKLVYRPEDMPARHGNSAVSENQIPRGAAEISRPPSGASSLFTGLSSMAEPSFPSNVSVVSSNDARKIYGGKVSISQNTETPMSTTFPTTPFDDSPLSPRYFWVPPENLRATPAQEASSTRAPPSSNDHGKQRQGPTDQSEEHAGLARHARRDSTTAASDNKKRDPARPSSPKSRNCSRNGRGERSDSVLAKRPPSALGNHQPPSRGANVGERRSSDATRPRNASRTAGIPQQQTNATEGQRQSHDDPLDMEKLGAELMIFEEGPRPRRDSLECHADEDDFIVVHSSKREQIASPKPTKSKQPGHKEDGSTRSSSRQQAKKTPAASTTHGKPSKPSVSPPQASSRPRQVNSHERPQESPAPETSRTVSRGRPRHAPYSPRQDSPTFTPPVMMKDGRRSDAVRAVDKQDLSASPSQREEPSQPRARRGGNMLQHTQDSARPGSSRSMNAADKYKPSSNQHSDRRAGPNPLSITTPGSVIAPAPDGAPKTPRAMILFEDGGRSSAPGDIEPQSAYPHDGAPLKCIDRDSEAKDGSRPKSVMW